MPVWIDLKLEFHTSTNWREKKATNIIIIFICSTAKPDPLRDTHIVTQKWNRYMCIPAELLQSGMVAKYILKNKIVLLN